jgi:hypothetical protein
MDLELAVCASQVRLDSFGAHEQLGGDLTVAEARGGEFRNPALRGCQLAGRGVPRAEAGELG